MLDVAGKQKNQKTKKTEKQIIKKTKPWKKSIKILKKSTGSVLFGFGFISLKPKKLNRTQPSQTKPKPSRTEKLSQTGLNLFLF